MIIWLIFKPEFSTFFFVIHQPSPSVGVSWWTVSSCGQIWSIREIIWIIILWSSYPPTVSSGLSCINHFLDNDNDDCMDNRYLRIIMFVQQEVLSAAMNAGNMMKCLIKSENIKSFHLLKSWTRTSCGHLPILNEEYNIIFTSRVQMYNVPATFWFISSC